MAHGLRVASVQRGGHVAAVAHHEDRRALHAGADAALGRDRRPVADPEALGQLGSDRVLERGDRGGVGLRRDRQEASHVTRSVRGLVQPRVEDQVRRRGSEGRPRHHARLVDARLREVAHAAGKDRAKALQFRRRERGIRLRIDRRQLAFQHVGVNRPAGDEARERRRGIRRVALRVGLAAEGLRFGEQTSSVFLLRPSSSRPPPPRPSL